MLDWVYEQLEMLARIPVGPAVGCPLVAIMAEHY